MLGKYLVIGLGGSAETLIRFLNQDIEQRLRSKGWNGEVPGAWRWLAVDVPQRTDVVRSSVPGDLGRTGSRVGLAKVPHEYEDFVLPLLSNERTLPALVGSLLDPKVVVPPPYKGAGRRPQVGYAVGLSRLRELADAIDRQVTSLDSQTATDELAELARGLGTNEDSGRESTTVIVASSIGGGAGAGLVQLVVELLLGRATNGAQYLRTELMTVLFTPDIFAELSTAEHDGMQANALHTVSAILNGYEATGELPDALAQLLGMGGTTLREGRRAAATNFFVGRRNAEIAFDHQHAVIQATARAIGRIMVDEQVAGGLAAHLDTNRTGAAILPEFRIVDPASTSRPASSLGYASVSLGGETLAEYAAERLAKAQMETLLRGHRAMRLSEREREDATIERVVAEQRAAFLEQAGLNRQDVLDGLYSREQLRDDLRARVFAIQEEIKQGERKTAPNRWGAVLASKFTGLRQKLDAETQAQRTTAARVWSEAVSKAILDTTAATIGHIGIPITIGLLDAAHVHVLAEAEELDRERLEGLEPKANARRDQARKLLQAISSRTIRNNDEVLSKSSDAEGHAEFLRTQAGYNQLAAKLLREFAAAVLLPLRASLADGAAGLAQSERGEHRVLVEGWSSGAVPTRIRPAPNERVLDSVDSFPELVGTLLQETLGVSGPVNAEAAAAAELITGVWPSEDEVVPGGQTLIATPREWRANGGATGTAQYRLVLDAADVLERSRAWVRRRRGALAERLRLPISAWIDMAPGNAEALADALDRALRCAAPLMSVNPAVHVRVHGTPVAQPTLYVGTIPIAEEHRIRRRVQDALHAAGVSDGAMAALFDATSRTSTIEISGFLHQPVHPVVIDGLFVPIQRDWQARTSPATREEFASFRRTRPLPLFVPLSPARQRRFVQGWITAIALGQLDGLSGPHDDDKPLSVWTPQGRRTFPIHLLGWDNGHASANGNGRNDRDLLAHVLGSLSLALASFASQQYGELEAYMRILDLGDLGVLQSWIATGRSERLVPGTPDPPVPSAALAGSTGDTPDIRRTALRGTVDAFRADYGTERAARPLTRDSVLTLDSWWEIGDLVVDATDAIRDQLAR